MSGENGALGLDFAGDVVLGMDFKDSGGQHTFTHSLAATALANRTLATPSTSLSKRTTFVTSPSLAHSSRMSSLISSMAAGSSYS